jgi:hypothetical protein
MATRQEQQWLLDAMARNLNPLILNKAQVKAFKAAGLIIPANVQISQPIPITHYTPGGILKRIIAG